MDQRPCLTAQATLPNNPYARIIDYRKQTDEIDDTTHKCSTKMRHNHQELLPYRVHELRHMTTSYSVDLLF